MQLYLLRRGEVMPGWTTILENVNAVSNATRSFILDAQLAMIFGEGLADGCAHPAGVAGAGLCWQSKTGVLRAEYHPCVVGAAVAEETAAAVV